MKNRVLAFIMLTLTAIGGAAVVSAIRQRACQGPLRMTRRLGAVDRQQQQVLGQGAGRRFGFEREAGAFGVGACK
jgi:hypothetical protein